MGTGVKSSQGVTLTPHPFSYRGHERVELYLYSPMGRTACTEPQCLYKGALYLYLNLNILLLYSIVILSEKYNLALLLGPLVLLM
jgi:hypothetical protein